MYALTFDGSIFKDTRWQSSELNDVVKYLEERQKLFPSYKGRYGIAKIVQLRPVIKVEWEDNN